jgi:hypothetical protein
VARGRLRVVFWPLLHGCQFVRRHTRWHSVTGCRVFAELNRLRVTESEDEIAQFAQHGGGESRRQLAEPVVKAPCLITPHAIDDKPHELHEGTTITVNFGVGRTEAD